MPIEKITKRIEFDAGHRIPNHASKCRNMHGHRYVMDITLEGDIKPARGASDDGMILDFGDIKDIAMRIIHDPWDHGFLVWADDMVCREALARLEPAAAHKTIILPVVPTAENLARLAFQMLDIAYSRTYGPTLRLTCVRLYETPNSWADALR